MERAAPAAMRERLVEEGHKRQVLDLCWKVCMLALLARSKRVGCALDAVHSGS